MTAKGPLGLSSKEKGGVFFLFGDDDFRKDLEARALVDWHLDPGTRDFNLDQLRGTEVDVEGLASVIATPPMMAEWRVVLLREVEGLAANPKARTVLTEIAANPLPGLALILVASIPRSSKAKFYGELKRLGRSVEFPAVGPNDVPGWLLEWTRARHGMEMTEAAARALGAAVGTDLGILAQEVEKLSGVAEEGASITVETVRAAGTRIPSEDRWAWMDRVGNREYPKAMKGLQDLYAQGESGVGLIVGLATHLLRLGLARAGGPRALEGSLPPRQKFLASRLGQQARKWTVAELEEALLGLRRADRLLKSSTLSDDHVLEEWLLSLMASTEARV